MSHEVRVLVVDDQEPFRRAARAVLGRLSEFELVGEAGGGEEAVALAATLEPDLVLMDIRMPGMGGIEATRRIARARPATTILLVSSHSAEDLAADAMACGAAACMHKEEFGAASLERFWRRATQES